MSEYIKDIDVKASTILENNIQEDIAQNNLNIKYFYICPSIPEYQHQWLWDSCFHIIVNSHLNIEYAKKEFETLLKLQEDNGFLPHIYYWKGNITQIDQLVRKYYKFLSKSSITQTPILADALCSIYRAEKNIEYIRTYIGAVRDFYDFLYTTRRNPVDPISLLNIIHVWESGIDNSPLYDAPLNIDTSKEKLPSQWMKALLEQLNILNLCEWNMEKIFEMNFFLFKDILFNCTFIEGYRLLAELYDQLEEKGEAETCIKRADEMETILIREFWDKEEGLFFGTYGNENKINKVKTSLSLIPLILTNLPNNIATTLVFDHLLNEEEFWSDFPIPSVALDEPTFSDQETGLLWRGPSWININWFIIKGLKKHGFENVALQLAQRTFDLIEKSGFSEYYHPQTGEAMGARDFGWSTLVIDIKKQLFDFDLDFIFDKEWTRIKRLPGF
jgi:glycogen debranching enzyme